jgi:hypothetical protein
VYLLLHAASTCRNKCHPRQPSRCREFCLLHSSCSSGTCHKVSEAFCCCFLYAQCMRAPVT